MGKLIFYGSIFVFLIAFLLVIGKKQFKLNHLFLMISYSLYNLIFETVFGEVLGLYYYIDKKYSLIYIILAAVFVYPVIAALYVFFLTKGTKVLWYTLTWVIFLLFIETITLYTKTIILTGWRVIPWSVLTYMVSFWLIYLFNYYIKRVLLD